MSADVAQKMTDDGPGLPPDWHDDVDGPRRLRVPPHSMEAEQCVLGALLIDASVWDEVCERVAAADFFAWQNREIFVAIAALIDGSKVPDIITVHERLRDAGKAKECGGIVYLNALVQSVPSASGARQYANIVRDRAILRGLIAAADAVAVSAYNVGGRSVREVVDGATEQIAGICREHYRKSTGGKVPLLALPALRETAQAVRWLVKRVVPADSIGMMFGGSGTFKSFLMLDCALHVAHGMPWMGRRTRQGPVIYIAAEGGAGLWSRIDAWHRARSLSWGDLPFYVVPAALDLQADAWRVVDAAQAVGVCPALVIVDTLSQTYAGEENSAGEMAAYLRELGARFRMMWGCAVMLVHHTGHNATERPRGSSVIRANVDFLLGAFRDEKEMLATVTCVKQKDGELFDDAVFQLRVMDIGEDDDGERITSLVARHLSSADEVDQARNAEQAAGRGGRASALMQLAREMNGQEERHLRKAFYDQLEGLEAEAKKKAYSRAKHAAVEAGQMEIIRDESPAQGVRWIVVVSRNGGAKQ
ncbi:MAG: AAA family ATPase [Aquabacterium sp.]|nr:AAA family ATPase [Aquabacterium sp.]